ncbi:MAG: hypothetical protein LBE12_03300 [Planctomycetaceae bacterium]|jgi:hypothetical protein|nr:hypothetical protein [Planctomycetaceae bacterium]
MNSDIIIANPIYDVVFKRLMDDTENAKFFIETLLDQEVKNIEFRPQEYPAPNKYLGSESVQGRLPGAMTFFRLDFLANIKTANGKYQKVLIEVQKGRKTLDIWRFRDYLAEHYKRPNTGSDLPSDASNLPLHIVTIYILGFDLEHITTPAVKIAREYIDLITKKPIHAKEDFAEQLTHDCIIVQTKRIHGSIKTELDALLSLFEQDYFVDGYGHCKKYLQPIKNDKVRRMATTLSYVATSEEGRKAMEFEESIRRIVEGDNNAEMQKIRRKLTRTEKNLTQKEQLIAKKDKALAKKDKALAKKDKALAEKNKALAEKNKVLATKDKVLDEKDKVLDEKNKALDEKDKALAEKDEQIAKLRAQLKSNK